MAKFLIFALISSVTAATTQGNYDVNLPPWDTTLTDLDVIEWTNIARTDPSRIVPLL